MKRKFEVILSSDLIKVEVKEIKEWIKELEALENLLSILKKDKEKEKTK